MPAQIRYAGLDSVVHLMTTFTLTDILAPRYEPTGNFLWTPPPSPFPYGDPVPDILSGCILDHGFRDSLYTLGLAGVDRTYLNDTEVSGFVPRNSRYHAPLDHFQYGSLISDLAILRANGELSKSRFSRDHNVRHSNLLGEIIPSIEADDSGDWFQTIQVKWGYVLPAISGTVLGPAGTGINGWNAMNWSLPISNLTTSGAQTGAQGSGLFHEILPAIADGIEWTGHKIVGLRPYLTRWVDSVSYDTAPDRVVVNYDYHLQESIPFGNWGIMDWQCQLLFELVPFDPGSHIGETFGVTYPQGYWLRARYRYRRTSHGYAYDGQEYLSGVTDWVEREDFSNCFFRSTCSAGIDVDTPQVTIQVRDKLEDFRKFNDRENEYYRKTAFYSTADAVEGHLTTLKNNYLESIKELPEIASLIPDLGILVKALTEFDKNPLAAGRDFVDFFTSFLLKFNFGWTPNADAVSELRRWSPVLVDSFRRFTTPSTIQLSGKFVYDFPEHPYWGVRSLTTRSTLMLEYSDAAFATHILGLESVGLLPSLHRTWEVLPYSFVIDWVTRMGRRLHDVDTQTMLFSLMTVHWVEHTYKVQCPHPSSVDLPSIDEESSSLEYRWFARDLSRRIPALQECKYDYRAASGPLNLSVLGSLIFQKAK